MCMHQQRVQQNFHELKKEQIAVIYIHVINMGKHTLNRIHQNLLCLQVGTYISLTSPYIGAKSNTCTPVIYTESFTNAGSGMQAPYFVQAVGK